MSNENLRKLIDCIDHSPTAFHAVATAEEILLQNGFSRLDESSVEALTKGGKYFITRNNSSIIAFTLPESAPTGLMICASHSDSPCFKVKPNAELETVGQYVRLNTERYGGMIMPSWFDRPLSLAGRIAIETDDGIETRLVNIDRDLLEDDYTTIQSVAIASVGEILDCAIFERVKTSVVLIAVDVISGIAPRILQHRGTHIGSIGNCRGTRVDGGRYSLREYLTRH